MNFTMSEIILLIIIVSIILIIFVILTIKDIKDYLRYKNKNVLITEDDNKVTVVNNIKKDNKVTSINKVDTIKEQEEKKNIINNKNVEIIKAHDKPLIEESEIVFEEEDMDPFYEEEDVVIPTKEEVIYRDVIDEKEVKKDLDKVSNVIVDKHEELSDTITNFEMEQEESAIISLDELMKVSDKLYEDNEPIQYDDGNEPITIDEVIKRYNSVKNDEEDVAIIKAQDTVKDTDSDLYIEEEEDFLTDLEIAHDNLRR